MNLLRTVTWIGVFGLAAGLHSVAAHHSTAMFDHTRTVALKGTVVELRWVNPHVSLSVNADGKEGEQPSEWLLEMTSPSSLVRLGGWSRTVVKPGDRVEVEFSPLRSEGSHGGALKKLIILDSGKTLSGTGRGEYD
jgi:hypothetical protein